MIRTTGARALARRRRKRRARQGPFWTVLRTVPFSAGDVDEFIPQWNPIAEALAPAVGFDHGVWETEGQLWRIGSVQDKFGHVRPVLLFLPGGYLGDYTVLLRSHSARTDSTVLFPSGRSGEASHFPSAVTAAFGG